MPGAKLPPAVRLSSSRAGQDEEGGVQSPMVVELPVSSKFGFAWPAEPHPPVQQQPSSERGVSMSSSEGESDASGIEDASGMLSQTDQSEDIDHTSISRPVKSQQQTRTETMEKSLPRLSRAVSMPLPSRHLQNPRRAPSRSSATPPSVVSEIPSECPQIHELSLELADSVQMMIQTLLQISPSQIFDPAKEQFSACSLAVPTTCMSAMFTSMKNLNYISANMAAFCASTARSQDSSRTDPSVMSSPATLDDFDIGELLQSVGDTLSGAAAQAGVDLVLYHGDVGMKHVSVKGDECGLSYALLHVVRQVIGTASRGDSIEIGLFITTSCPRTRNSSRDSSLSDPDTPNSECYHSAPASPVSDSELPLSCLFDISHNFAFPDTSPSTPQVPFQSSQPVFRPAPSFNTVILQRLLSQVGASLASDLPPKAFVAGRSCELTVTLEPGCPTAINARVAAPPEDASYQLLSGVRIAEEPSLEELIQFTETLRGKKVTLYASSRGSFAHHLTSYLTAWGLDVSHVSPESGVDGTAPPAEGVAAGTPSATGERTFGGSPLRSPYGVGLEAFSQAFPKQTPLPTPGAEFRQMGSNPISFIFIDDDISVLRERLRKLRVQQTYPLTLSRKRPPLAAHHRPRSIPNVQRPVSLGGPPVVIVHFTSLAKFKLVKDVIQSDLASHQGSTFSIPEVMIIPKPAGPRRFLTALHTAVTKPIVDPFFVPIATSPIHGSFFNFNTPDTRTPSPRSPTGSVRPSNGRTNSDRSTKSPNDPLGDPINLPPPSPLSMTEGMEYFSEAAAKLGASPSSGLVIQNPSGQPAGIFFHPKGKGVRSTSNIGMDREKGQFLIPSERKASITRRPSSGEEAKSPRTPVTFSSLHSASISPVAPPPLDTGLRESQLAGTSKLKAKKSSSPRTEEAPTSPRRPSPMPPSNVLHKITTPPISPLNETDDAPIPPRRSSRRPTAEAKQPSLQAGPKGSADTSIVVPPISVLIVDDNPINQTILSTFMKKKKIKYDVAKNGEEAVEKWRSGGFHLILMDIQMPVMDGIQATKEIRTMERMNSASGFPLCTPRSETPLRTPPLQTPSEAPSSSTSTSTSSPYRSSVIIVALTASSLQSDRVAALAAGCNDFLTKPVSLQWLNNKIIEWGSIKALQMWADLRPEVVKSISSDQAAQARNVARRLHVPEGRTTPSASPSRSSSVPRTALDSVRPSPSALVHATLPALSAKDDPSDSSDNPVSDSDVMPPAGPRVFRNSKTVVLSADRTNGVAVDFDPLNLNEEPQPASDSNSPTGSI